MLTLDLEEEQAKSFTALELSEDSAVAISKWAQFEVQFPSPLNQRKFVVRPKGITGLIPISNTLLLRVTPKVPVENVFGMLELVQGLEFLKTHAGVGTLGTIEQVFDSVAGMFADRVSCRVRKGLYSEYVEEQETGHVLRGRLNVAATLSSRMRGDVRVTCSFETRTPDIVDNQVLLWTLDRIPRVGLRTATALDSVRAARRALLGTVSLGERSSADCRNRNYNRLNDDYRILHALSRFFLEAMGPRLTIGEHQFVPFTINMWPLFQEYVVATIRTHLPANLVLRRQHAIELGGVFDPFKIDAVIADGRTGQVLAVIDAKYKRDMRTASDDVHQVVAYASYTGAKTAVLVYPTDRSASQTTTPNGIRLCTLGLPLDRDLTGSGEKFCSELLSLL